MTNELLDAALLYASIGWRVFPLIPRGKSPAIKGWQEKATTDEAQIRAWWAEKDYNVGIATGNGLCVVDVDDKPKNDVLGSDMLREWELEHGEISQTCCVKTGSGGMHYYYDVGNTHISGCQSDTIFIDLRCDGNLIVAPPSIHPNGNRYVWDVSPEDMPPAKANAVDKACIQWVYDNRKKSEDSDSGKFKAPEIVREGEGRDNTLYKMACSMWAQNLPESTILAALRDYNKRCCKPPLPDRVVKQKLDSAMGKPPGLSEAAKKSKKDKSFKHNTIAKKLIDDYGACLIDGVTPAIRLDGKQYVYGWGAFDSVIIDLHDNCTKANRNEAKAYIQAKAPKKEQSPWNLIAFKNGVLDINTLELRDWRDDDVIANVIPHNWNPNAKSDLLLNTLMKMSCGDTATLMNMQEFIGICMLRSNTRMPFYPVLIGAGSNGKSSYIKLLKNILGGENISALQPKEIAARFMGVHIVGKLANLGDDIADAYLDGEDCGAIKRISTGENIFTDVKGTDGYYFEPYCTMVFSCNVFPRCKDTTEGFMRRLFPIEFNAHFDANDDDYDPQIGEKLREEETLEYACVIGVEGLRRAIENNQPTPNRMSGEVKMSIAADSNTGMQWFNDEQIIADNIIGKTKEEVYAKYYSWCERNGYARTALSSGTLSTLIGTYYRLKCIKIEHRNFSSGRKTVRVFDRIR